MDDWELTVVCECKWGDCVSVSVLKLHYVKYTDYKKSIIIERFRYNVLMVLTTGYFYDRNLTMRTVKFTV